MEFVPGSAIGHAAGSQPVGESSPIRVVERFLDSLARGDIDGAVALAAPDVTYENVGLPTVHGRERMRLLFRSTLGRSASGFDVHTHAISANDETVLTERTDVLKVRRLHVQLWVCGRFDVRRAQIVLWRDYFDQTAVLAGLARGALGALAPSLRAKPPVR